MLLINRAVVVSKPALPPQTCNAAEGTSSNSVCATPDDRREQPVTRLKDAGPLRVSDVSVVAQKTLEKLACLWLREVPNDLCDEKADLHLCMRQKG